MELTVANREVLDQADGEQVFDRLQGVVAGFSVEEWEFILIIYGVWQNNLNGLALISVAELRKAVEVEPEMLPKVLKLFSPEVISAGY